MLVRVLRSTGYRATKLAAVTVATTLVAQATFALTVPRLARAEPSDLLLTYTAAKGCPGREEFLAEVSRRRRPTTMGAADTRGVQIDLGASEPRIGRLVIVQPNGSKVTRTITGDSCQDVALALASSLAIALSAEPSEPGDVLIVAPAISAAPPSSPARLQEPKAKTGHEATQGQSKHHDGPTGGPAIAATTRLVSRNRQSSGIALGVRGGLGPITDTAGARAWQGSLGMQATSQSSDAFRFALQAALALARSGDRPAGTGSVDFTLASVVLRPCLLYTYRTPSSAHALDARGAVDPGRFRANTCAQVELGGLFGHAVGEGLDSTRGRGWVGVGPYVSGGARLTERVYWELGVAAIVALIRAPFLIGKQSVFEPAQVGARAEIIAGIDFD